MAPTAIRNGVSVILNQGDNVHKGDVVQSGSDSTLGITFNDSTTFNLSANSKIVIDNYVYEEGGAKNASESLKLARFNLEWITSP